MMGQWGPGMMGHGMGWFWGVAMLVFWISIIVGVIFLIRWLALATRTRGEGGPEDTALEMLKKRYARGEINREEYEEKKKVMET
jgi:putative membrane protein